MEQLANSAKPSASHWYEGARGVWLVWAGFALLSFAVLLVPGAQMSDPDALLRLQQVRDLLGGQSWWDVTQYRMVPPEGAAMHWSRLVDVPIAGLIWLFAFVMPMGRAEYLAMILVPLLYVGASLWLLRAIMLRLGLSEHEALVGLGLLLLFPLLPTSFAPTAIDHHVPQAVAALIAALMLLHPGSRRMAGIGGAACAVWLVISLEGLPLVAALAGLYGLRYVIDRDRALPWFLGALGLCSALLSLATRPASEFVLWCDILLPAHWAAFAAGALTAWLIRFLPRQEAWFWRTAALGALPLVCGPLAYALLGRCAADPFALLDPVTRHFWYDYVQEGMPFWRQPLDSALMVLWLPVTVLAGLYAALRKGLLAGPYGLHWALYGGLALIVGLYGMWLFRASLLAQLLAVPFAALAMTCFLPSARALTSAAPRIAATLACLLFITPLGATNVGKQFKSAIGERESAAPSIAIAPLHSMRCRGGMSSIRSILLPNCWCARITQRW